MSSVDAWLSLAETVAPCRDPAVRERLVVVLALLLAQSDDRPGVTGATPPRCSSPTR